MSNGIASLRRYQIGGGVGDPEEGGFEWFKRILRQLKKRGPTPDNPIVRKGWAKWWNEDPSSGLPPAFRSIRDDPDLIDPMRIWTAEDLDFLKDLAGPSATPEEEKLVRQLLRRWEATGGPKGPPKSIEPWGTPVHIEDQMKEVGSWWDELKASSHGKTWPIKDFDDLIDLSNLDITFGDEGMSITPAPLPHAVPPLSNTPDLGNVLGDVDKSLDNLSSVIDKFLRDVMGLSEWEIAQWHADNTPYLSGEILDQPVHDLDEVFRLQSRFTGEESIDDLIRGAGGRPELNKFPLPPTARFLGPLGSNQLAKWKDAEKEAAMVAQIEKMRSDEALRVAERKKNSGIRGLFRRFGSSSIPWGSTVAPFLGAAAAAAVNPLALAAEQAFDFAISPGLLDREASEVPGAGRTWRESLHIDPSDEEVASWMQTLLGDSPYSQSQLAMPSSSSQRAIEQLIRNARAGTPVNRYRR